MSEFFNHVPQTSNATNQVGNLATEVDQAFQDVEAIINQGPEENASIASSIGSLDNWYIKNYIPSNGLIQNYTQNLVFPNNSQEASLDLYPSFISEDLGSSSITNISDPSMIYNYVGNSTGPGVLVNPTDYTFVGRKVVFGAPPINLANQSETYQLAITYTGYNTTDNSSNAFDMRYNILSVVNGVSKIDSFTPSVSGTTYTVAGYNFEALCSPSVLALINTSPEEAIRYIAIYSINDSGDTVTRLDISNATITATNVTFTTTDSVPGKVRIYVANSSLGTMIQGLFRLFYAHNHGDLGGTLVNHGDLTGLYENTYDTNGNPLIKYTTACKTNYDHPQYLNREGYINDDTVYNNAMLGDLVLASTDIGSGNRFDNITGNSRAVIFGSHSSGHKVYYSVTDNALIISTSSNNGVQLDVPANLAAFSINSHTFSDIETSDSIPVNYLKLSLNNSNQLSIDGTTQIGEFKLTMKNSEGVDVNQAKIFAYEADFSNIVAEKILNIASGAAITFGQGVYGSSTNPPALQISYDGTDLIFQQVTPEGGLPLGGKVVFEIPVQVSELDVTDLYATNNHVTESKRIVFHPDSPSTLSNYTQYINYDITNSVISFNSQKYVNFGLNGYRSGTSLDQRIFTYVSSDSGASSPIPGSQANFFIESQESVYFLLPTDQPANNLLYPSSAFRPSVDNLTKFARCNIYTGTTNADTVNLTSSSLDGSQASITFDYGSDSIFSGRDSSGNVVTFLSSNNVIAADNYIYNQSTQTGGFQYSQFSANKFFSQPNGTQVDDPANGFYGNIFVGNGQSLNITTGGTANFGVPITFNQTVTFNGLLRASNIVADNMTVNQTLTVDALVTGNGSNPGNISLTSGHIFQQDSTETNTFMGEVDIFNNLQIKNGGFIDMNGGVIKNLNVESPVQSNDAVPYYMLQQTLVDLSGIHATMTANGLSADLANTNQIQNTDLNGVVNVGEYWIGAGCTNTPFGTLYSNMKVWRANDANVAQIVQNLGTNRIYIRTLPGNGSWTAWQALAYKSEIDYLQSEIDALLAGIYNGQVYATGTNGQTITYTVPAGKQFRIVGCGGGAGGGGVAIHIHSDYPGTAGTASTGSINGGQFVVGGGGGPGHGSTIGNRSNTYFGVGAGGAVSFTAPSGIGVVNTTVVAGQNGYGTGPVGGGGYTNSGSSPVGAHPLAALATTYSAATGYGLGSTQQSQSGSTAGGGGAGGSFDLMLKNVSGGTLSLSLTAGTAGAGAPTIPNNVYAGPGDCTTGFVAILI